MRYKIAILILLLALPALAREGGSITTFIGGCFNKAGDGPLDLGTATFYEPGSTTIKPVYENNDLTGTVESGVVEFNADGRLTQVYYGDGLYKVVLADSAGGNLITYDNVRFGEGVVNTSEVRLAINAQDPLYWNAGTGMMSIPNLISSDKITDTGHTNKFFTVAAGRAALAAGEGILYDTATGIISWDTTDVALIASTLSSQFTSSTILIGYDTISEKVLLEVIQTFGSQVWTTPTLNSYFAARAGEDPQWTKLNGVIYMRGAMDNGSIFTPPKTVFGTDGSPYVLPVGSRPKRKMTFRRLDEYGTEHSIIIDTGGQITADASGSVGLLSFEGISFIAEQ